MRRLDTSLALLALCLSGGCAQNAIMELQIALPAAPSQVVESRTCSVDSDCTISEVGPHRCVGGRCAYQGPWFVRIEPARSDLFEFVDPVSGERLPWSTGGGAQLDSEPLTASPRFSCTSVVTGNSGVEAMNLRVRFCRSPACTALIDNSEYVEEWYRIERPFYTGKRTYFRNFESPTSPTVLDVPYCSSNRPCFNGRPCVNNHCGCATDADCGPARLGWTCSLPEGQCLRTVTRCNVVGCIGTETPFNMSVDGFCTTDTGPHFCQQNPSFDYVNPCAD